MDKRRVVVLGTGGAGLTAALAAHDSGAEVQVFEKADKIGGTTAWSGGMVWIPNNHLEAELGVDDSREEALLYLNSMSHDLIEPHMAEAFVDAGPLMVRYLCENTPVNFRAIPDFPDYHAEFPGGKTGGGRSLDCPPFSYDDGPPAISKSTGSASGSTPEVSTSPNCSTQPRILLSSGLRRSASSSLIAMRDRDAMRSTVSVSTDMVARLASPSPCCKRVKRICDRP